MSFLRFGLLLIISCWITTVLFSQPERLYFNHLTVRNGLSQATNYSIYKDSRGFVWISSLNGLNRFDGQELKVYKHAPNDSLSLPDNYIQSDFFEAANGDLWFSTYRAIVQYRRATDDFKSYQLNIDDQIMEGYHLSYLTDNGLIYVIVKNTYLYQFSPDAGWEKIHTVENVRYWKPQFDIDGKLASAIGYNWDTKGFYYFNYQSDTLHQVQRLFHTKNTEVIYPYDLLSDKDGLIWIGAKGALFALQETDLTINKYTFPAATINRVTHYDDRFLLLSCGKKALVFFDKITHKFVSSPALQHQANQPNSLTANMTLEVYVDNTQTIWTNIANKGIDYAQPKKVKFPTFPIHTAFPEVEIDNGIFCISEAADGHIYISSRSDGIMELDTNKQPIYHYTNRLKPNTLPSNDVFFILTDTAENVWAFTWSGLAKKQKKDDTFRTVQAGQLFLHGVQLQNQQLLFAAIDGGIYRSSTSEKLDQLKAIDSTFVFTYLFENQSNKLYAAHDLSAIEVYATDNNFKTIATIPLASDVLCMQESRDQKYLYIGTNDGLVQLHQKDYELRFITEKDGLADQTIYGLLEDNNGYLWLTTNRGIIRYHPSTQQVTNFGIADGVQGLEFNRFSWHQRLDGEIWLGGAYGLNVFHPNDIQLLADTAKLQFTNLLINDQAANLSNQVQQNISELTQLQLPYFDNTISIQFAAMEYSSPTQNQFRYRINDYDEDWIKSKTGFARYANLPAGNYTFTAQASNSDGVWGISKGLQIIIHPPYWQTWWFRLLIISIIATVFYGIYRYRLTQIKRLQRLRNNIAANLHDDIGSNLSHVNLLTALIRQQTKPAAQLTPLLERIEEEIQHSTQSLDDIIFSINPKNDSLKRTFARMRWFANDVFEAKDIKGVIDFPKNIQDLKLGMEKRQHFYLFFKEALNNLAKYADCQQAKIEIRYHNQELFLIIQDDGKGFDTTNVDDFGNGLHTMQHRAIQLGGKMEIESVLGQGTRISLRFLL